MNLKEMLEKSGKKTTVYYKNKKKRKSFDETFMTNWIDAIVKSFYTDEKIDQFKNLEDGEEKDR